MHLPSLFVLVVYISGYLFLLFAAICLACGLYYLVELAEEFTTTAKKLLRITTITLLTIHVLLFVYERFPFLPCFIGFIAHLFYLSLLGNFPVLNPTSPIFLLSSASFIIDNIIWWRFFHSDHELFYRYRITPAPSTASFFLLIIWLVPLALFCSLSVNDAVLPSAAPGIPSKNNKQKHSRNVVAAILDSVAATVRRLLGSSQPTPQDLFASSTHQY